MIIAVSPRIAEQYGDRIRQAVPGAELVSPTLDGGWSGDPEGVVAAYFSEDFWTEGRYRATLPQLFTLPNLRWFHTFSAGVDNPAFRTFIDRGVILTNAAGTTAEPIAQYVIAMMLRVVKRMDDWAQAQREKRWEQLQTGELTGKTVGIIGVGHIGGEVARLAQAFRMRVIGCRRRARKPRNVDELVSLDRLGELLGQSDFVVLALPLSAQSENLISKAELQAMKSDAWLINISRGNIVDEEALVRALERGEIGGACLDVARNEPLPEESELWTLPNVIITPHNSGWSPLNLERGTELFLENLRRFAAGRPLKNRVRAKDF
ncbi:MAG: D-2-hydroxyacid dehydrogenase [Chloroflexi bacterium]|nr:D-2-hydroxyacid dehydrogenase [Chloroflexota bacterium]